MSMLVDQVITPHAGNSGEISVSSGPDVVLSPKAAVSLSMILHELMTNALKHGALSNNSGRVRLAWDVIKNPEGRWLSLSWREDGGPPVEAPTVRGFGSSLIEQSPEYNLGGKAFLEFDCAGVMYELKIPLNQHTELQAENLERIDE